MAKKKNKAIMENKIILEGVVLSISRTQNVTKIMLSTSPSRNKDYRDLPTIVCFGKVAKQAENLKPQDHARIECAMLSVRFSKQDKYGVPSYLVASKVSEPETLLSKTLGVTGTEKNYEDKNDGVIAGVVTKAFIFPNNKGMAIGVTANANGRLSFPEALLFDNIFKQAKREQIKKGDTVAIGCYVKTGKDSNGKPYESLVAKEFKLIGRA